MVSCVAPHQSGARSAPQKPNHGLDTEVAVFAAFPNTIVVSDCNPAMEGITRMVATLNESNNFDVFVRTMRTKFREM